MYFLHLPVKHNTLPLGFRGVLGVGCFGIMIAIKFIGLIFGEGYLSKGEDEISPHAQCSMLYSHVEAKTDWVRLGVAAGVNRGGMWMIAMTFGIETKFVAGRCFLYACEGADLILKKHWFASG